MADVNCEAEISKFSLN